MDRRLERDLAYLRRIGAQRASHGTTSLLEHLARTRRILSAWGASRSLCDAALFHSVYGTSRYRTVLLPARRRSEIRARIGARAEQIVWLFATLPRGRLVREGEALAIPTALRHALANLCLANDLEQEARVKTLSARGWKRPTQRLLPRARSCLQELHSGTSATEVVEALLGAGRRSARRPTTRKRLTAP